MKIKQLTIPVGDTTLKNVSPTVEIKPLVETYKPRGRHKQKYFRLKWREANDTKTMHIPGGNVNSKLAQYRAEKLKAMINRGAELGEIIAAVKTYASEV